MNENRPDSQSVGITPGDVYFIIFRQKWTILAFSVLGILAAVVLLFVVNPPQYQSQALISIRYVVEGKSLNLPGDEQNVVSLNERSDSVINTEVQILNSLDLAGQVVQAVTPEKILANAGGGADTNRAAFLVRKNMTVEQIPDSSVIRISYQNTDPELVQPVLSEIIDAYITKHVQMHQGLGVPNNFLTNEIARLRGQLAQTDNELSKIISAAGVISVDNTQTAYAEQISKIRQDLFDAEADLAERQAMVEGLTKSLGAKSAATNVVSATETPRNRSLSTEGFVRCWPFSRTRNRII